MSYCNTHRSDTAHSSTIEGLTTPRVAEAPAAQTGSEAVPGVGAAAPCAPVASLIDRMQRPVGGEAQRHTDIGGFAGACPEAPPAGGLPSNIPRAPTLRPAAAQPWQHATGRPTRHAERQPQPTPRGPTRGPKPGAQPVSRFFAFISVSHLYHFTLIYIAYAQHATILIALHLVQPPVILRKIDHYGSPISPRLV